MQQPISKRMYQKLTISIAKKYFLERGLRTFLGELIAKDLGIDLSLFYTTQSLSLVL